MFSPFIVNSLIYMKQKQISVRVAVIVSAISLQSDLTDRLFAEALGTCSLQHFPFNISTQDVINQEQCSDTLTAAALVLIRINAAAPHSSVNTELLGFKRKRQNRRRSHDPGEHSTHYISFLTLESFSSLNKKANHPGKAETLLRCALHLFSFSIITCCRASARLTAHRAKRMLWMWDHFFSYSCMVMQKAHYCILPACFSNETQPVFI